MNRPDLIERSASGPIWSAARPREGWVTSVTFDPDNPDIVFATYGGIYGDKAAFITAASDCAWANSPMRSADFTRPMRAGTAIRVSSDWAALWNASSASKPAGGSPTP